MVSGNSHPLTMKGMSMEIKYMQIKDTHVPFEQILAKIRGKQIEKATVSFSRDSADYLFYSVNCEIANSLAIKTLDLKEN